MTVTPRLMQTTSSRAVGTNASLRGLQELLPVWQINPILSLGV